MPINLTKTNTAVSYAAMRSVELKEVLTQKETELKTLKDQLELARSLKKGLAAYSQYKPFSSEYIDAALGDVSSDIEGYELKAARLKRHINLIEALITFKTNK